MSTPVLASTPNSNSTRAAVSCTFKARSSSKSSSLMQVPPSRTVCTAGAYVSHPFPHLRTSCASLLKSSSTSIDSSVSASSFPKKSTTSLSSVQRRITSCTPKCTDRARSSLTMSSLALTSECPDVAEVGSPSVAIVKNTCFPRRRSVSASRRRRIPLRLSARGVTPLGDDAASMELNLENDSSSCTRTNPSPSERLEDRLPPSGFSK
mmetsp:Transcript_9487/g.21466  ORF Transcript_9487/g.21466 Transcript_9487/m.21466 type:complete len:208 (-) Transcript_9487:74-697(-)